MATNSKTEDVATVAARVLAKFHEANVQGYGGDALKVTRKEAERLAKAGKLSPKSRDALLMLANQLDHRRALVGEAKKELEAKKVATTPIAQAPVKVDNEAAKLAAKEKAEAAKKAAEANKLANEALNVKLLADFASKPMMTIINKVLAEGKGIVACLTYAGGELDIIGLTSQIDRVPRLVLVNFEWAAETVTVIAQDLNNPAGYHRMRVAADAWLNKPSPDDKPVAVNQEPEVKKAAPKKNAPAKKSAARK